MTQRVVQEPWTVVATDVMGPFPRSKKGHEYLVVFQDLFSKWIELAPLKKANAESINAAFLELVVTRWGTPKVLHSDSGTEFNNRAVNELSVEFGIHRSFTPLYHPQANPVERTNRVLKTMIRSFIDQDHRSWDLHLNEFRFAYNTALHSTNRVTPAFLNMGREPRPRKSLRSLREGEAELPPPDLTTWTTRMARLEHLRELMSKFQDQAFVRQAKYYDRQHRDLQFKVGDKVKKPNQVLSSKSGHVAAKLAPKFSGPFIVVEVISPNVYALASPEGRLEGRYHASHVQKYVEDQEDEAEDPGEQAELDRLLFEIRDSGSEEELEDGGEEVFENPELDFDWESGNVEPLSDSELETENRVRLRNRSYSN